MYNNELYHHGVKGQKWGIRRFQNYDGTLIKKGKEVVNKGKEFAKKHKKLVITGAALAGTAIATIGGIHAADIFLNGQIKQAIGGLINQSGIANSILPQYTMQEQMVHEHILQNQMQQQQIIENNMQEQMIQEQMIQEQLLQQQMLNNQPPIPMM